MAFLEEIKFTGRLGDLSAYRVKGSDKIVLRRKGGASKEMIKNDPAFALPRRYMSEFGGCSAMGKYLRSMLGPQRALKDYNISHAVVQKLTVAVKSDTTGPLGKRRIALSDNPALMEGFSLNEKIHFNAIIQNALPWQIDRAARTARVEIPALMPRINFSAPRNYAMFSIVAVLGVVPDFTWNDALNKYTAPAGYENKFAPRTAETTWCATQDGMPATVLELREENMPPDDAHSLMLSVGVRFGVLHGGGVVEQARKAGAAKVLAMA